MSTMVEPLPRTLRSGHAGADWLVEQFKYMPDERTLSPLGRIVADILGEVFFGLYHLPQSALYHKRTKWENEHCVSLTFRNELATHDGSELTRLVLLSHAHGVRLSIRGAAPGYMQVQFTMGENMWCGTVPSVEQIVERFNATYPAAVPR